MEQLSSMLKAGVKPDFIILHYGGADKVLKGFKFLNRTLKQRKIKTISYLFSRRKNKSAGNIKYKLSSVEGFQGS